MTDAFPNYFSGELTLTTANTFTTVPVRLPINRIGRVSGTKATVLEFLWISFTHRNHDFLTIADNITFTVQTGGAPTGIERLDAPDVIANWSTELGIVTSGAVLVDELVKIDLQSADGHGQLVAAEEVHISGDSTGMATATAFHWRIYYRFVQIPAMEMMGILQSQM